MKKIIIFISNAVLVLSLNGCTWFNAPHLYGNQSCGENKTAYVYTSGTAAICLSERSVAYMVCSRELAITSDTRNNSVTGTLSVPVSGIPSSAGLTVGVDTTTIYAAAGELEKARANAINTCIEIYNSYR